MGAVDEGVAPAPVGRVEQLRQAVGAGGGVGADQGGGLPCPAFDDVESGVPAAGRAVMPGEVAHLGQGRDFLGQSAGEGFNGVGVALHQHFHPGGVVAHRAGEVQFPCEMPDIRAKADALDDAGDAQAALHNVVWIQRNGIRGFGIHGFPDCTLLHPGYSLDGLREIKSGLNKTMAKIATLRMEMAVSTIVVEETKLMI